MKAKFGSIVTSGSGKLGGMVVTTMRGFSQVSRKRSAKSTPSALLESQNSRYSALCSTWNSLDSATKSLWSKSAASTSTGFTYFLTTNLYRSLAGLVPVLSPVVGSVPFSMPSFSVTFCPSQSHLVVSYPLPIEPSQSILVYASKVFNGHSVIKPSQYICLGALTCSLGFPINIFSLYVSKFGSIFPVSGYIGLKFVFLDNASGVVAPPIFYRASLQQYLDLYAIGASSPSSLYGSVNTGSSWAKLYTSSSGSGFYRILDWVYNFLVLVENGSGYVKSLNLNDNSYSLLFNGGGLQPYLLDPLISNYSALLPFLSTSNFYYINIALSSLASVSASSSFGALGGYVFLPFNQVILLPQFSTYVGYSSTGGQSVSSYINLGGSPSQMYGCYAGSGIVLVAKATPGHIHRSVDFGKSFSSSYSLGLSFSNIKIFYVKNDCILAFCRFSTTRLYIYRSIDQGISWSLVFDSAYNSIVNVLTFTGSGVITVGLNTGVFYLRSSNWGLTWSVLAMPAIIHAVRHILWINDSLCFAFCSRTSYPWSIYRSIDGALTWSLVFTAFEAGSVYQALIKCNNNSSFLSH